MLIEKTARKINGPNRVERNKNLTSSKSRSKLAASKNTIKSKKPAILCHIIAAQEQSIPGTYFSL